jgi:hypothetical protein
LIIFISICAIFTVGILCFHLRSHLRKLRCTSSKPVAATQTSPLSPSLQRDALEPSTTDEHKKSIVFASYGARQSDWPR